MINRRAAAARHQLETLWSVGRVGDLDDDALLAHYHGRRDGPAEAVFRVLVERHAPMVLSTCRRVLGDGHDAQDAAQAVFLVLAQGRLDPRPRLGRPLAPRGRLPGRRQGTQAGLGTPPTTRDGPPVSPPRSAGRRSSRPNRPSTGRSSTARSTACRRSTAPPSSCATSKAGRTRTRPAGSAAPWGRSASGSRGPAVPASATASGTADLARRPSPRPCPPGRPPARGTAWRPSPAGGAGGPVETPTVAWVEATVRTHTFSLPGGRRCPGRSRPRCLSSAGG